MINRIHLNLQLRRFLSSTLKLAAAATLLVLAACAPERANAPSGAQTLPPARASAPDAPIDELNRLRAIGGLKPVTKDAILSHDCYEHAKYLVEQGPADPARFLDYRVNLGLGVHTEDPHSKDVRSRDSGFPAAARKRALRCHRRHWTADL